MHLEQLDEAELWMYTDAAGVTTELADKVEEVKAGVAPILDRACESLTWSAILVGAARAVQAGSTGD